MKECRSHIVLLFPSAGKFSTAVKTRARSSEGEAKLLGVANLLQPFDSELFFLSIKCIRDAIRAEEHRITCQQSQGQRLVVRRGE